MMMMHALFYKIEKHSWILIVLAHLTKHWNNSRHVAPLGHIILIQGQPVFVIIH
jgi:hypothetical protein